MIGLTIIGKASFISIVLYMNFIKFKYILSDNLKIACGEIDYNTMVFLNNPGLSIIKRFYVDYFKRACAWFVKVELPK